MRPGTKPQSTEQKRLAGNPGKRRLNAHEPKPPRLDDSFDTPPPALGDDELAVAEWRRLAPMLRQCRQITEADRSSLVALCIEWSRYLKAMTTVRAEGFIVKAPSGYPITSPYLSVANRALANCGRLWAELGLTPSSRSRVQVPDGPGPGGDAFSEFDEPPPTVQ